MNDLINHPKHYTSHPSGLECIEITEHMNFCLGNAVKYLFRNEHKHADPLIDLRKSLWYLHRDKKRVENISSRFSLRSIIFRRNQEQRDRVFEESRLSQEWLLDRYVFLSSCSPLIAHNYTRNFSRLFLRWWKGGSKNKKHALDRVIAAGNWEDIRSIRLDSGTDIEKRILAISKFIGLNDDWLTRAIYYIWRADMKGNAIEDLKKAIWYLQDEIKKREGGFRENHETRP